MSTIKTILLIEDNPFLRDDLSTVLTFEGFEVWTAVDGREGLQKLQDNQPDLVICDYNMPHVDGGEVLQVFRSDPQNVQKLFILMSGITPPENLKHLEHIFLAKPIALDTLIPIINSYASKAE